MTDLDKANLQYLENVNRELLNALQYLVDTKKRKDTIGKDSIYFKRKNVGWSVAKRLLQEHRGS